MELKFAEGVLYDTIVEAPVQFEVGGRTFSLHPKSLGMIILINRLRDSLEIDDENVLISPTLEMLRVCEKKRDIALRMIAYCVLKDKDKIFNPHEVGEMMKFFGDNLTNEDMATLLAHVLRDEHDTTQIIKGHFKIDEELDDKKRVIRQKKGNSITFGGRTIFGALFDFMAQRYGWTVHHMVWEMSYNNLMMMYYDCTDSVYLSDGERNNLSIGLRNRLEHKNDDVIAATKQNMELIRNMDWR